MFESAGKRVQETFTGKQIRASGLKYDAYACTPALDLMQVVKRQVYTTKVQTCWGVVLSHLGMLLARGSPCPPKRTAFAMHEHVNLPL